MITVTNECNMQLMGRYPDGYFDIGIVDPPYGINADKGVGRSLRNAIKKGKIGGGGGLG